MAREVELGTLAIDHGDLKLPYRLTSGGYSLGDQTISISIDCEAVGDKGQFPPSAKICIQEHPIDNPPKVGDVYSCRGGILVNDEDIAHRAWGYFTFHVEQIWVHWRVEQVTSEGVVFGLEASHDDVNYHGAQARETSSHGRFLLSNRPPDELWLPALN